MKYKYKNITFNYKESWVCDYLGMCDRETGIGFTMLDIPSKHIIGMKKDGYYKEVNYNGKTLFIPPHTHLEDYRDSADDYFKSVNSDLNESYNTDLHIVYIKWMLEQNKEFEIDITCENPYWIFHDIAHSNDVQCSEVCCLNKHLEECRLQEGIDIMIESGYTPEFDENYYEMILDSHRNRWGYSRVNIEDIYLIFGKYITYYEESNS